MEAARWDKKVGQRAGSGTLRESREKREREREKTKIERERKLR